jgi:hypothetical protein
MKGDDVTKSTTASSQATQSRLPLGPPSAPTVRNDHESFVPGVNPKLPAFVAHNVTPYDANTDTYDVRPFDRDLVIDKATPPKAIYDMHGYWSKKHWAAIREYVRHYLPAKHYPNGKGLILDCFTGSGMTGVAAVFEDRPCVLIDASPAATFISHCYTHPVDPDELRSAYDAVLAAPYPASLRQQLSAISGRDIPNLAAELQWLYETRCDRCGGSAGTDFVVYSERYQCPVCAEVVPLFDCPEEKVAYTAGGRKSGKTELKKRRVCPHCRKRRGESHRDFVISTRAKRFGAVPVLVRYRCSGHCRPASDERRYDDDRTKKARFFREHDLAKLRAIYTAQIPHWTPNRRMMDAPPHQERWGEKWQRFPLLVLDGAAEADSDDQAQSRGTVSELFDKRNLWALAAIRAGCVRASGRTRDALLFSLTAIVLNSSRMYRYRVSGKGGFQSGNYYIPQLSQVMCTSKQFADKLTDIVGGYAGMVSASGAGHVLVSEGSADELATARVPSESIDFVFTDPPYLNTQVQYGEMNFVWNAWLDLPARDLTREITISPIRGMDWSNAENRLRQSCLEIARLLKPGRYAAFCYHDTSEANWRLIQDALLDSGLVIETVTALEPAQKSQKQLTKEKIVKSDLVVNCRKPRSGEQGANGNGEVVLVSQRVRDILIETLSHAGGQPRDRLWDVILKRLLTRGQMAEHRFDDILSEIAFRSESGRWFLKEEFESLSEDDIKNEEKAGEALVRFARLRMAGVTASLAAEIVLRAPELADGAIDDKKLEKYVRDTIIKDKNEAEKFELGGRLKGAEFYDCLFFYLTRWLKGRAAGKTPRRNLAEFLGEYLVHFKDGDRWLNRAPDDAEAQSLRKARQTGLARRIRQYVAFLQGEGDYARERIPDARTTVAWLKHCRAFGLAEEGVLLFEKSGIIGQLDQLSEDDRYDAQEYYEDCRRKAGRSTPATDDQERQDGEPGENEGGDDE